MLFLFSTRTNKTFTWWYQKNTLFLKDKVYINIVFKLYFEEGNMLALKLIIAISIIIICTMLGMSKSKKYESREHILRESIMLFKGIENEIKYSLSTVPNAIEMVRQNMHTRLKDVLGSISYNMLKGNISSQDISFELDNLIELTSYDKQVITQGLSMLGKSDVEGEIGVISLAISNLENQLGEAIESKKKNSKLYKTIGMATGLMLAIVFI